MTITDSPTTGTATTDSPTTDSPTTDSSAPDENGPGEHTDALGLADGAREDTDDDANAVAERPGGGVVLGRAALGIVVLSAALSVLAALGSWAFGDGRLGAADVDLVGWLADNRSSLLDTLATNGSALSDTWTIIGLVLGSWWMLWILGHRRFAAMVVLTVTIELTTFLVVGAIVDRARPDVEALHSVPSTPSFPSGHTAAAFAVYGALVLTSRSIAKQRIHWSLWLFPTIAALVVAFSRVYEGVHHPSDVIAGFLLGLGALGAAAVSTGVVSGRGVFGRGPLAARPDGDASVLDRT